LQNLRSGRAVSVLIDRLRDKDELPETRQHAASALAAIRSYRAIQELRSRYADTDEDSALRFFIGRELDQVHILVSPSGGPVPSF
jgi:HEAT repeat protein